VHLLSARRNMIGVGRNELRDRMQDQITRHHLRCRAWPGACRFSLRRSLLSRGDARTFFVYFFCQFPAKTIRQLNQLSGAAC
jgi:hypothetical protein